MSMPTKTREDIRRDEEVEYLTKAVKIVKDKTTALQDIMEEIINSATKIACGSTSDSTSDAKTTQELAQQIMSISLKQSRNIGMLNGELDAIEHGLTRVRSNYF